MKKLALGSSLLLITISLLLGGLLAKYINIKVAIILALVSFLALLIIYFGQFLMNIIVRKEYDKKTPKKKAKTNKLVQISQEYLSLISKFVLFYLYIFFLLLLSLILLFALFIIQITIKEYSYLLFIIYIPIIFLILAIMVILFSKRIPDLGDEKDIDSLKAIVGDVLVNELKITQNFVIEINALNSVSARITKGTIVVYLGIMVLDILSESELRALLFVALSKLKEKEAKYCIAIDKSFNFVIEAVRRTALRKYFTHLFSVFAIFLSERVSSFMKNTYENLKGILPSLIDSEKKSAYINAIVKLKLLYIYENDMVGSGDKYEKGELTSMHFFEYKKDFFDSFRKYNAIYLQIVNHEINKKDPQKSTKEIMKAANVDSFNIDFSFTNKYQDEVDRKLVIYNQIYKDTYENQFLDYLEKYNEKKDLLKQREKKLLKKRSVVNLLSYGELLFDLRKLDDALKIFLEILEADPNNARAHFFLGMIYLLNFNNLGIDLIYKSFKNEFQIEGGLEIIENYVYKMGLEEEIKTLEAQKEIYLQENNISIYDAADIDKHSKLVATDLPTAVVDDLIKEFTKYQGVEKIYLMKKINSDAPSIHILGIELSSVIAQNIADNTLNDIFLFLDLREENFALYQIDSENLPLFNKVNSALKYDSKKAN